jgi:hypothetical protein
VKNRRRWIVIVFHRMTEQFEKNRYVKREVGYGKAPESGIVRDDLAGGARCGGS